MDKKVKTYRDGSYYFRINEVWLRSIPIETVLDIGCNVGNTIKMVIDAAHPKKIYGFEPRKSNFDEASQKLKEFPEVELINAAVSDYNGESKLFLTEYNACNSLSKPEDFLNPIGTETVKVIRIDTWAQSANISGVDYVKIDTQAGDLKVLQGMGDLLNTVKILKIEVWFHEKGYENTPMYHEVAQYLEEYNMFIHNFPLINHDNKNQVIWADAVFMRI